MEKKKLLVFDLDGTLLNDHKDITPRTRAALKRARQKGYALCFASGRCEEMMSIYRDAVGGCDYMVSCNGAMTRSLADRVILQKQYLEAEEVTQVLTWLFARRMDFMMYSSREMYFSAYSDKLHRRVGSYEKLSASWGFPVKLEARGLDTPHLQERFEDIIKIVVYEDDGEKLEQYHSFICREQPGLFCESTGDGLLGTFHEGVSKKWAVEAILAHMQIGRGDVYVFGDYENDRSMFAAADHRIAMGNAIESLKCQATHVTDTNNRDGVARYLEEILGI